MKERMSYLNGLVDGLELSKRSKEGEVIKEITVALEEFAEIFEAMDMDLATVEQTNETQEERLSALERDFYGESFSEIDYQPDYMEVQCPSCNELVTIEDASVDEESPEVFCPVCRTFFLFDGEQAKDDYNKEATFPEKSREVEETHQSEN